VHESGIDSLKLMILMTMIKAKVVPVLN